MQLINDKSSNMDDFIISIVSLKTVINAGAGDDIIIGSKQNDTINGDLGKDTIIGGLGDDMLRGGSAEV